MSEKPVVIEGVLLEAGVSNRSGRMYSEECLIKMQEQLNEKIKTGTAFISDLPEGGQVRMDTVYGQLDHADIDRTDGPPKLKIKAHLFDVPKALAFVDALKEAQKDGETLEDTFHRMFEVRPSGVGRLNQGNVVDPETYRFLCANIFPKGM